MTNLRTIQAQTKRRVNRVLSYGGEDFLWERHRKHVEVVRNGVFTALRKAGFKGFNKSDLLDENDGNETETSMVYPSLIDIKILPIKNSPICTLSGYIEVPVVDYRDDETPDDYEDVVITGSYDELIAENSGSTIKDYMFSFSCEYTKDWKKIQKFKIG